jgi:hypothetical protein
VDDPIATALGSDTKAARLALRQTCSLATTPRSRVSLNDKLVARYNLGRSNKSLDASGGSASRKLLGAAKGALIRAAASTQTLCFFSKSEDEIAKRDMDNHSWIHYLRSQ